MLVTTIQCAPYVDNIDDKGNEYTKQPYPYHISPGGNVLQQGFWRGTLSRLAGFQASWDEMRVDVHFFQIQNGTKTWDDAKGMYPVMVDSKGNMFALAGALDTWSQEEFSDERIAQLYS